MKCDRCGDDLGSMISGFRGEAEHYCGPCLREETRRRTAAASARGEGYKADEGKLDWTLFPFDGAEGAVRVLMLGEERGRGGQPVSDRMKPWLIGESNPWQAPGEDPDHVFDLYPLPEHASGGRLARILGMSRTEYLRAFNRRNLLAGPWREAAARLEAARLTRETGVAPLILLGAKVARAFGLTGTAPWQSLRVAPQGRTLVTLPHPSGRCRAWGDPNASARARALVLPLLESLAGKETKP